MIPILFTHEDYLATLLEDGNGRVIEDGNGNLLMVDLTPIGFQSYGVGALSDAISCEVEEERNGAYELTMEYPISGIHFSDIALRALIVAKPNYLDDPQPFRIYKITKPLNGKCTIYARHWSYGLSDIPVRPFTAPGLQSALSGLISNAMYDVSEWRLVSTRATSSSFKVDVPSSIRSWFGGKEGSLLDIYGGEWHYRGRECRLENSRGENRGVVIRYGVNLTELEQEENCAEVYTGVLAYWADQDGNVVQGTVQEAPGTYDYVRILTLDCSDAYDEAPTAAQLNAKATAYIEANNVGVPKVNLTLDFVMLQGLLNRVDLCDTVTVEFEKLGISATAKCIRVRWNVLLDRYEEVELGDARSNLTEAIIGANDTADLALKTAMDKYRDSISYVDETTQEAVRKITGNLGGYVILHDSDDDGYPDELLIMDTDDITTATNVWRWNQQGLMHADSYTGTYANAAITMDGQIVADAITTGTLRGIRILSDNGAGGTVDIVDGTVTVSDANDTWSGKARMETRYVQILANPYGAEGVVAQLANEPSAGDNTGTWGGTLSLNAMGTWKRGMFLSIDRLNFYDFTTETILAALRKSATQGGELTLKYLNGTRKMFQSSDSNGGYIQMFREGTVVNGELVDGAKNMEMRASSVGGTLTLYNPSGNILAYLGYLSHSSAYGALLEDTPSLAFYKDNGNGTTTIKSWYTRDRAFIADETFKDSGGNPDPTKYEYGYVVHGHDANHGYTFGFATTGEGTSDYRTYLWVYVDGESMGYIPITASSDARYKSDIEPISDAYKRAIAQVELDTFFYDFTTPVKSAMNNERRFGVIAQDLITALESEGIDPMESELVTTAPDPDGERYLVNYTPFLVARLAADEDRIKALEDRIRSLEERLEVM